MAVSQTHKVLWGTAVVFMILPHINLGLLSDFKICCDHACESIMSRVQAIRDHHGKDCRFLSFKQGDIIFVYHKLTGKRDDIWAGSIDRQFGYFPKDAVQEEEVHVACNEKVVETQNSDFFCMDEFGYIIDSSHLDSDDVDDNVDEKIQIQESATTQTTPHSDDTNTGSPSASEDVSTEQGADGTSSEEDESKKANEAAVAGTHKEAQEAPKEQGGSAHSPWLSSSVTGWLGLGTEEEPSVLAVGEKKEESKETQAEASLASSVTGWLGLGGEGETDDAVKSGGGDDSYTSTMTGWLGFGGEKKTGHSAEKEPNEGRENDKEQEPAEKFRSRRMSLDLEGSQLHEEEKEEMGTLSWLGNGLSNTLGFGLTNQESESETITEGEPEDTIQVKEEQPAPSSWFDMGVGNILGFGKDKNEVDEGAGSDFKGIDEEPLEQPTGLENVDTSQSQHALREEVQTERQVQEILKGTEPDSNNNHLGTSGSSMDSVLPEDSSSQVDQKDISPQAKLDEKSQAVGEISLGLNDNKKETNIPDGERSAEMEGKDGQNIVEENNREPGEDEMKNVSDNDQEFLAQSDINLAPDFSSVDFNLNSTMLSVGEEDKTEESPDTSIDIGAHSDDHDNAVTHSDESAELSQARGGSQESNDEIQPFLSSGTAEERNEGVSDEDDILTVHSEKASVDHSDPQAMFDKTHHGELGQQRGGHPVEGSSQEFASSLSTNRSIEIVSENASEEERRTLSTGESAEDNADQDSVSPHTQQSDVDADMLTGTVKETETEEVDESTREEKQGKTEELMEEEKQEKLKEAEEINAFEKEQEGEGGKQEELKEEETQQELKEIQEEGKQDELEQLEDNQEEEKQRNEEQEKDEMEELTIQAKPEVVEELKEEEKQQQIEELKEEKLEQVEELKEMGRKEESKEEEEINAFEKEQEEVKEEEKQQEVKEIQEEGKQDDVEQLKEQEKTQGEIKELKEEVLEELMQKRHQEEEGMKGEDNQEEENQGNEEQEKDGMEELGGQAKPEEVEMVKEEEKQQQIEELKEQKLEQVEELKDMGRKEESKEVEEINAFEKEQEEVEEVKEEEKQEEVKEIQEEGKQDEVEQLEDNQEKEKQGNEEQEKDEMEELRRQAKPEVVEELKEEEKQQQIVELKEEKLEQVDELKEMGRKEVEEISAFEKEQEEVKGEEKQQEVKEIQKEGKQDEVEQLKEQEKTQKEIKELKEEVLEELMRKRHQEEEGMKGEDNQEEEKWGNEEQNDGMEELRGQAKPEEVEMVKEEEKQQQIEELKEQKLEQVEELKDMGRKEESKEVEEINVFEKEQEEVEEVKEEEKQEEVKEIQEEGKQDEVEQLKEQEKTQEEIKELKEEVLEELMQKRQKEEEKQQQIEELKEEKQEVEELKEERRKEEVEEVKENGKKQVEEEQVQPSYFEAEMGNSLHSSPPHQKGRPESESGEDSLKSALSETSTQTEKRETESPQMEEEKREEENRKQDVEVEEVKDEAREEESVKAETRDKEGDESLKCSNELCPQASEDVNETVKRLSPVEEEEIETRKQNPIAGNDQILTGGTGVSQAEGVEKNEGSADDAEADERKAEQGEKNLSVQTEKIKHADDDQPYSGESALPGHILLGQTAENTDDQLTSTDFPDDTVLHQGDQTQPEDTKTSSNGIFTERKTEQIHSDHKTDTEEVTDREEREMNVNHHNVRVEEDANIHMKGNDGDTVEFRAVMSEQALPHVSQHPTGSSLLSDGHSKGIAESESGGAFGLFKNAFSYFSPTPATESTQSAPSLDSPKTQASLTPDSTQVHVQDLHTDTPIIQTQQQQQQQQTSSPSQTQTQSHPSSLSPNTESPLQTKTLSRHYNNLLAYMNADETAILMELFGRHKMQFLDYILGSSGTMTDDPDSDKSILLDIETLLHYSMETLVTPNTRLTEVPQEDKEKTKTLIALQKLEILLARVRETFNTGKSDPTHQAEGSCVGESCSTHSKDKEMDTGEESSRTGDSPVSLDNNVPRDERMGVDDEKDGQLDGRTGKTKDEKRGVKEKRGEEERVSPESSRHVQPGPSQTLEGVMKQILDYIHQIAEDSSTHVQAVREPLIWLTVEVNQQV